MAGKNLTALDHLKLLAQEAVKKINGLVSEIASTTASALEEMNGAKQDKAKSVSVTIPSTGWKEALDEDTPFPLYCDVTLAGVTAQDVVDVYIAPAGAEVAEECGLSSVSETVAGAVRLRAEMAPSEGVKAECRIIKA